MSELLSRHRAVIPNWVGIYYDEPIEIVSGKGCRVTDAQGRGYLDFFAPRSTRACCTPPRCT